MNEIATVNQYQYGIDSDMSKLPVNAEVFAEILASPPAEEVLLQSVVTHLRQMFTRHWYQLIPSGDLLEAVNAKMALEAAWRENGILTSDQRVSTASATIKAGLDSGELRYILQKVLRSAIETAGSSSGNYAARLLNVREGFSTDSNDEPALRAMLDSHVQEYGPDFLISVLEYNEELSPDSISTSVMKDWLEENDYISTNALNTYFSIRHGTAKLANEINDDIIIDAAEQLDMIHKVDIGDHASDHGYIHTDDIPEHVVANLDVSIFPEDTIREYAIKELEMIAPENLIPEARAYDVEDIFDHATLEKWALENGFVHA